MNARPDHPSEAELVEEIVTGVADGTRREALAQLLAGDDRLRAIVGQQLLLQRLIGIAAHDSRSLIAEIQQQIVGSDSGQHFTAGVVERLQRAKPKHHRSRRPARARRWPGSISQAALLAAMIALSVMLAFAMHQRSLGRDASSAVQASAPVPVSPVSPVSPVAQMLAYDGQIRIDQQSVRDPSAIIAGQTLTVGGQSWAHLRSSDGTIDLRLAADTVLRWEDAHQLRLEQGEVMAAVSHQHPDHPLCMTGHRASITVRGTRFRFAETSRATALDVHEGAVEFRSSATWSAMITAGMTATATAAGMWHDTMVCAWNADDPSVRAALGGESAIVADPRRSGVAFRSGAWFGNGDACAWMQLRCPQPILWSDDLVVMCSVLSETPGMNLEVHLWNADRATNLTSGSIPIHAGDWQQIEIPLRETTIIGARDERPAATEKITDVSFVGGAPSQIFLVDDVRIVRRRQMP